MQPVNKLISYGMDIKLFLIGLYSIADLFLVYPFFLELE